MKKVCKACGIEKIADRTENSEFGWMMSRGRPNCKLCVNKLVRRRRLNNENKKAKKMKAIKDQEAIERNPHGFLAADVIEKAILDWRKYGHIKTMPNMSHNKTKTEIVGVCSAARSGGYASPHDELLAFFAGIWFEELCDLAEVDVDYMRKHIGV